jgi:hypothetical protein
MAAIVVGVLALLSLGFGTVKWAYRRVRPFRQAAGFAQSLALIEARARPGRGVAYGTTLPAHLLNVAASNMSALPSEPGHFVAWLAGVMDGAEAAASYAPRALYGDYLHEVLNEYVPSSAEITCGSAHAARATERAPGPCALGTAVSREPQRRALATCRRQIPFRFRWAVMVLAIRGAGRSRRCAPTRRCCPRHGLTIRRRAHSARRRTSRSDPCAVAPRTDAQTAARLLAASDLRIAEGREQPGAMHAMAAE